MKSLYFRFLSVFTAITVLSGSLIGFVCFYECEAVLKAQLSDFLGESARSVNEAIASRVGSAAGVVRAAAKKEFMASGDTAEIERYLKNAVELSDFFYNIYYFSSDAKLSAAAYSDNRDVKPYIGLDYNGFAGDSNMRGFRASAHKAIELKSPLFSNTFYSPAKKLLFTYIAPVISGGKAAGLLSAAIYANDKNFQNFITALKSHPDQFICLFDSEDRLIASTGEEASAHYSRYAALEPGKVLWNPAAEGTEACLVVKVREPGACISTLTGVGARAIKNTMANLRSKIISYTLLAIAAVIFISILFSRALIRPIKALVDGLKRVDEGVYTHRISAGGAGEIDEAIAAFNKMNEKLHKSRVIENLWNERWND